MSHHTAQLLEHLTGQTEEFLRKAVSEWQMLPPEVLSAKPSPEKWSAAQCLEHLNIYGRHYLPEIEKAIGRAKQRSSRPSATFYPGWLG
ncbi:MAG: DinB family protein, partial [Saprospiraceae bacterium]|nr:DinB family protein [Saprospiraceae bacterium]